VAITPPSGSFSSVAPLRVAARSASALVSPRSHQTPYLDQVLAVLLGVEKSEPTAKGKPASGEANDFLVDGDHVRDPRKRHAPEFPRHHHFTNVSVDGECGHERHAGVVRAVPGWTSCRYRAHTGRPRFDGPVDRVAAQVCTITRASPRGGIDGGRELGSVEYESRRESAGVATPSSPPTCHVALCRARVDGARTLETLPASSAPIMSTEICSRGPIVSRRPRVAQGGVCAARVAQVGSRRAGLPRAHLRLGKLLFWRSCFSILTVEVSPRNVRVAVIDPGTSHIPVALSEGELGGAGERSSTNTP